ncbi:hypothetical protein nublan001_09040 [Klebsiella pneumoniae]
MRNINVTINTRNAFVRESLVAMVNDLTRAICGRVFPGVTPICQLKISLSAKCSPGKYTCVIP